MILVTLGTQNKPFARLLAMVEEQIAAGAINEPVTAQVGHTPWASERMEVVPFLSAAEMARRLADARLVISHAGAGTLIAAIAAGKTVIAVPRLAAQGEHVNDHQRELVEHFADAGYLIDGSDGDLAACLERAADFEPARYDASGGGVVRAIAEFIG